MNNKPICYVPSRVIPEVYSGVPTFLGLPKISNDEDLAKSDIVVMGVPWEGICTYGGFSACELSPKTIREASRRYGGYLPDFDLDIFDHFTGGDFGDCPVQNGDYDFTFKSVREKYKKILDANKIPVVFGGDHSISYPLISEFAKKHNGNIGIIQFDAHMDNMDEFGEEKLARCSPFHRLYEDENIDPTKMVHFGIRGPRNNPAGLKEAKKYGATVLTMMQIRMMGLQEAIQKAISVAGNGTEAIYVTVCSDILDIAFNPAGPPDPCGFTTWELAMALYECGLGGAKAFDYMEIYPLKDPQNTSSHVAVWEAIYFLAGVTKREFKL